MQSKNNEKFYATADLKRLAQRLVETRLTDEARKLVVVAIASEPPGVAKQNELSPDSTPAIEKALELLENRDLSRDSMQCLAALIREMPMGHRAHNYAEVQNRRLSLTAKYIRLHADEFFYENEIPGTRQPLDSDDADSRPTEEGNTSFDEKKG